MNALADQHLVRGVDHAAFPTFDPAATVRFYRDTLRFPVVHSICAAGWGPEDHPDFIHFFFDIGNDDRIAFFFYFGLPAPDLGKGAGDAYARFDSDVPEYFVRSRHIALHVESEAALLEYRRRLDASEWPVEMQIQHETIESIYTHDPNGYFFEVTRALRPVTPQEDLDANLTINALVDVVQRPGASMDSLLVRKAELILEQAEAWADERAVRAEFALRQAEHNRERADGWEDEPAKALLIAGPEGPVRR
jgi:catechol 2,3-dioxygenase-like lactoylglutathione lyase family enzyme